jgi:uncharacterized protein YggE
MGEGAAGGGCMALIFWYSRENSWSFIAYLEETMKNLLISSLSFFFLAITGAYADSPMMAMQHVISVSGEGSGDFAPDQAILSLSVVSKDTDLAKAKRENDALTEKLVAVTRDYKIPKEKIATSAVNINPEYSYTNGQQKFIDYAVNRSLRITVDDLSITEKLLSAVVDAQVNQINGVEYTLADPESHAMPLRTKAFNNAKAKAVALAEAAGVKLGAPVSISTQGAAPPVMPVFARAMALGGGEAAPSVAPTLPGMITLHETVNVVFALE